MCPHVFLLRILLICNLLEFTWLFTYVYIYFLCRCTCFYYINSNPILLRCFYVLLRCTYVFIILIFRNCVYNDYASPSGIQVLAVSTNVPMDKNTNVQNNIFTRWNFQILLLALIKTFNLLVLCSTDQQKLH